ncbi:hypothetical protein [Phascolarctobacterium sp.]|uniref:hypothetical protein n=1 Tax=Phascolarctobacterium sp. TaxID=2049039 RepID=UPI0038695CBF
MLSLFEKYKNENKIREALLVGQNLCNQNPADGKCFSAYFSYLCDLAEKLPSFADREGFAERASVALAFYSENAVLTSEQDVDSISDYQRRLGTILDELNDEKMDEIAKQKEAIRTQNIQNLSSLYSLKSKIRTSATQETFEKVMLQIEDIDNQLTKDYFTEEQKKSYESLTKEITDITTLKMRELEYAKNLEYNKKAAEAFAKAFKEFKSDESNYKNQTQLFNLVSKTLFAFDASRLFNETLIYYSHVYSYIFSKLDDDGKLALTRYSFECERKLK